MLSCVSQAFDCSIRKDEHLAVAFFQRGMTFYKKKRQETQVILIQWPQFVFIFNTVIKKYYTQYVFVIIHLGTFFVIVLVYWFIAKIIRFYVWIFLYSKV